MKEIFKKALKVVGAMLIVWLFSVVWDIVCLAAWGSIVGFFADPTFVGFVILSIGWSIGVNVMGFIFSSMGAGIVYLINGSKSMMVCPLLLLIYRGIMGIATTYFAENMNSLPYLQEFSEQIREWAGAWYGITAIITCVVMFLGYVACASLMFVKKDD